MTRANKKLKTFKELISHLFFPMSLGIVEPVLLRSKPRPRGSERMHTAFTRLVREATTFRQSSSLQNLDSPEGSDTGYISMFAATGLLWLLRQEASWLSLALKKKKK